MEFAATEFTVKIFPTGISRMRQEANLATAAVDRTACQTAMSAQNGIQRQLILTNKRTDAVLPMPFSGLRKELPDGYDKNARFSVRILMLLSMSPSYLLDAQASSGRAGIFLSISTTERRAVRTTDSSAKTPLCPPACPSDTVSPVPANALLGKENRQPAKPIPRRAPTTYLPSSGSIYQSNSGSEKLSGIGAVDASGPSWDRESLDGR